MRFVRWVRAPERLYLAALALSGLAALGSVALPPAERGDLVACLVAAALGAALGGLSVDTFLLSRPAGWVVERGGWRLLALLATCAGLAAATAAGVTAAAGLGSYPVAAAAAAALTLLNACAALTLRLGRFTLVYAVRAGGAALLVGGYAALYGRGVLRGDAWSGAWLAAQSTVALVLAGHLLRHAGRTGAPAAGRPPSRGDLAALLRLHVGVCAQQLTYRLDQILLARLAGAGALGVYALAVAALEFAQAGAVVAAQRTLAHRRADPPVGPVLRAAAPVAALAVGGLAAVGAVAPGYGDAWLLGLLLLPGCLAVAAGKTWSAGLLLRRGERATTAVALLTLAVAVPCYLALVPLAGAVGAAVASSCAYGVYALCSRRGLRRPRTLRPWTA